MSAVEQTPARLLEAVEEGVLIFPEKVSDKNIEDRVVASMDRLARSVIDLNWVAPFGVLPDKTVGVAAPR